jgi:hypothetical protein
MEAAKEHDGRTRCATAATACFAAGQLALAIDAADIPWQEADPNA